MKTFKFSTLLIAIASIFTFSSCLDDNDGTNLPTYSSYVTIAGDAFFGYTFYSDFGCILKPTQQSVQEVLPGLSKTDVKRAMVAFDLLNEAENGKELKAGEIYDIVLRSSYYSNYAVPTYQTIDIAGNTAAADTLTANNKQIYNVQQYIWAANGYLNAQLTISYDPDKQFYLNTFYDRKKDIDVANNTLYLTLYYNHNSTNPYYQGNSVFSFDLPDEAASQFKADSINVVLRSLTNSDYQITEVGKCRMALDDFFVPSY